MTEHLSRVACKWQGTCYCQVLTDCLAVCLVTARQREECKLIDIGQVLQLSLADSFHWRIQTPQLGEGSPPLPSPTLPSPSLSLPLLSLHLSSSPSLTLEVCPLKYS